MALSIAKGRSRHHAWISLCPTSGDVRDMWKWPFTVIIGTASRLSPEMLKGSQRTRTQLHRIWQDTVAQSFPHAARNLHSAGMLRNDTERPLVAAAWPMMEVRFVRHGKKGVGMGRQVPTRCVLLPQGFFHQPVGVCMYSWVAGSQRVQYGEKIRVYKRYNVAAMTVLILVCRSHA